MGVSIRNINYYLPKHMEDGTTLLKDNPGWKIKDIEKKTGVRQRFIVKNNESITDLAISAAEKLFRSGINRGQIQSLILVTQSADRALPTISCTIQDKLKLPKACMAFDINLGCSGFVYGLAVGSSLIENSLASNTLLICGDIYSKYIGKHDRTCRPLFSDGAAAVFLEQSATHNIGPFVFGTDGSGAENLITRAVQNDPSTVTDKQSLLFMDGAKILMFTMSEVPKVVNELLDKAKLPLEAVDLFVFHQASKLVIDNLVRRMNLPEDKIYRNYQKCGNTVSATIPIALLDAVNEGRLKPGDRVVLVGFGGGYSWGGVLLRWT